MTISICCKCRKRIKIKDKWYDVNREDVEFLEREPRTHGYCPDCYSGAIEGVQKDFKECVFVDCSARDNCTIKEMPNHCSIYKERKHRYDETKRAGEEKGQARLQEWRDNL